jgi:hypothetical protein
MAEWRRRRETDLLTGAVGIDLPDAPQIVADVIRANCLQSIHGASGEVIRRAPKCANPSFSASAFSNSNAALPPFSAPGALSRPTAHRRPPPRDHGVRRVRGVRSLDRCGLTIRPRSLLVHEVRVVEDDAAECDDEYGSRSRNESDPPRPGLRFRDSERSMENILQGSRCPIRPFPARGGTSSSVRGASVTRSTWRRSFSIPR